MGEPKEKRVTANHGKKEKPSRSDTGHDRARTTPARRRRRWALWRLPRWRACREHAAPRSSVRARRFLFLAVMGSYSFAPLLPPRSYSTLLLSVQPSAPAVTDSVQAPEVQQPGTRPPRCSSRQTSSQRDAKGSARARGALTPSQRVLAVLRAEAPGAAGRSTCRSQVLT